MIAPFESAAAAVGWVFLPLVVAAAAAAGAAVNIGKKALFAWAWDEKVTYEESDFLARVGVCSSSLGFLGTLSGISLAMRSIKPGDPGSLKLAFQGFSEALFSSLMGYEILLVCVVVAAVSDYLDAAQGGAIEVPADGRKEGVAQEPVAVAAGGVTRRA